MLLKGQMMEDRAKRFKLKEQQTKELNDLVQKTIKDTLEEIQLRQARIAEAEEYADQPNIDNYKPYKITALPPLR